MSTDPQLSVIVCTANRRDALRLCLESLLSQSLPLSCYEIIVINNVPEEDGQARSLLRDLGAEDKICYAAEAEEGLSPARNHGISLAKSDILVFIDDDAVATSTWLESLLRTYDQYPDAAAVGGKISLIWESAVPVWLHPDLYGPLGELDYGMGCLQIEKHQRLGGGNFSIRRNWFERCGGFLHQLGRNRKSLLSGEETELLLRVWEHEGKCYYNSDALVWHPAPVARLNKKFFRQRIYWGSRSEARMDKIHLKEKIISKVLSKGIRFTYHLLYSFLYKLTCRPALSFLWETFCWSTAGYSVEIVNDWIKH